MPRAPEPEQKACLVRIAAHDGLATVAEVERVGQVRGVHARTVPTRVIVVSSRAANS